MRELARSIATAALVAACTTPRDRPAPPLADRAIGLRRRSRMPRASRTRRALYLVKQRLYSLIVSTLDEGGVGEEVVKKFMDSFKLL